MSNPPNDDKAPALFGFKVLSDPDRRLRNVRIIRPDDLNDGVLNVVGITGRRVGSH